MIATQLLAESIDLDPEAVLLVELLLRWGPLFLFLGLIFFWFRGIRKRTVDIHERSMRHMDRIEQQTEEMLRLLRSIRDQGKGNATEASADPQPSGEGSSSQPGARES